MSVAQDWVTFQCVCGFRLERVPHEIIADLPRCLGCGRNLRKPQASVSTRGLFSVRDMR